MEYSFTLTYQLADDDRDPNALVERLGEPGCDDALVGIGQPGRLALEFTREANNAEAAVRSALADVRRAVLGRGVTRLGGVMWRGWALQEVTCVEGLVSFFITAARLQRCQQSAKSRKMRQHAGVAQW